MAVLAPGQLHGFAIKGGEIIVHAFESKLVQFPRVGSISQRNSWAVCGSPNDWVDRVRVWLIVQLYLCAPRMACYANNKTDRKWVGLI